MGYKPPPPRPDSRITPQSIHGSIPLPDRREWPVVPPEQERAQMYQVKFAQMIKEHRQEEQEVSAAYQLEMNRIAGESRPMDTSTHSPGYILANTDSRRVDYWVWYFSWRHYAFFWIVIDIALTGVALYITFSPKF